MKFLLVIPTLIAAAFVWAAEPPPVSITLKGEVLEIKDVDSYTYLRLKTKDGETWAAVSTAPVKKGTQVMLENVMVMTNFESKALNKTFKTIVFGNLAGTGGSPTSAMSAGYGSMPKPVDTVDINVPKASGPNAQTVADVVMKTAQLKDKQVVVRGKVVKYNSGIMGKNWIHLRDGTGSAAAGSNDLLVTTQSVAKLGDVVTMKGTVRADKDFGAGYSYKVLVEDATLSK